MTDCITYRMSFKAQPYKVWGKRQGKAERFPSSPDKSRMGTGTLTPAGGPGRLNKSSWSSSWYFCASWLQTETCCCQPKAQILYSCCSEWARFTVFMKSVWGGQTLHAAQPDWTRVSALELPAELETLLEHHTLQQQRLNTLPHQSNQRHPDCLKGQRRTDFSVHVDNHVFYSAYLAELTAYYREVSCYNVVI